MMSRTIDLLDQVIQKLENRLGVSEPKTGPFPDLVKIENSDHKVLEKPVIEEKHPEEPVSVKQEESKVPIVKDTHKDEETVDLSLAPYDLFPQLDIRVGNIVECTRHPTSDNLYCEKIDLGEPKLRDIGSGLQQSIPIEEMAGNVCVMANLKPRKLGGFNSCGMVMAIHNHSGFALLRPGAQLEAGERLGLEGVIQPGKSEFLPVLNPKKKVLEKTIQYFATDAEGFACFGLKKLLTSAGYIKTNFQNSKIS